MALAESLQVARSGDRRHAPRRAEDVALHYAGSNVIACAIAVIDARDQWPDVSVSERMRALDHAVQTYKQAEQEATS